MLARCIGDWSGLFLSGYTHVFAFAAVRLCRRDGTSLRILTDGTSVGYTNGKSARSHVHALHVYISLFTSSFARKFLAQLSLIIRMLWRSARKFARKLLVNCFYFTSGSLLAHGVVFSCNRSCLLVNLQVCKIFRYNRKRF